MTSLTNTAARAQSFTHRRPSGCTLDVEFNRITTNLKGGVYSPSPDSSRDCVALIAEGRQRR